MASDGQGSLRGRIATIAGGASTFGGAISRRYLPWHKDDAVLVAPDAAVTPKRARVAAVTPIVRGRVQGKVAVITGGAGNIGESITRRYLAEGATVVITGRNAAKLDAYRETVLKEGGYTPERVLALAVDGADVAAVRAGMAEVARRYGRIDILVNNAGSAGPKQPLAHIPLTPADLREPDTETLGAAFGNLLGLTWNTIRAAYPYLSVGASVINVSTIFSRTDYYGRIAYVVPKAALNVLSLHLARELGQSDKGVRLNTIYPGPIDSARIRTVFRAMDALKGQPEGSTAEGFFHIMRLKRPDPDGTLVAGLPKTADVAATALFLGSDDAAAFSGHVFEVTNGMAVEAESRSTFVSRPGLRIVDANGKVVLVAAGDATTITDALAFARTQAECGAQVALSFRSHDAIVQARAALTERELTRISTFGMDAGQPESVTQTFADIAQMYGHLDAALILPAAAPGSYGPSLLDAEDDAVAAFTERELAGAVAFASALARFWADHPTDAPKAVFVTNAAADDTPNPFDAVYHAGIEQLCRVWRHEAATDAAAGKNPHPVWANQIVRYSNCEPHNLDFAAAWAAKILNGDRRIDDISLFLPQSIEDATGAQRGSFGWAESLFGLHLGKVALITGGSAGIGGQIGRLLALSGAKVMLAARNADSLVEMRESIIRELREIGYSQPHERVIISADSDVADEAVLGPLVEKTLAAFGHIDYLINNAGMSGAEEVVIDMPIEAWRYTQRANLISNYSLIRKVAPMMKAQGSGYIVNVSSYFGGEKYVAVPYPNRADYAVSKAGQRALVEILSRFLGPEIQINAIAPGPVDGIRLQGSGGKPGLYQRRGRLILEGKRLNEIYAALIESKNAQNLPGVDSLLPLLAANSVSALANMTDAPAPLVKMAQSIAAKGAKAASKASAHASLMNGSIAKKLIARLELGDFVADTVAAHNWLDHLPPAADLFFTTAEIEKEAARIRESTLEMLDLRRMPNEQDVALATVYYLADRAVSGETFHPSGGIRFDRSVTEGELFGKPSAVRLEKFQGRTIFILGEYMTAQMERLAHAYLDEHQAGKIVLLTHSQQTADAFAQHFAYYSSKGRFHTLVIGDDIEGGLSAAMRQHGKPIACVSTPFVPVPRKPIVAAAPDRWDEVFSEADFAALVENHLTHHFRVARKMSLVDGAQVVLVTPETSRTTEREEFGLANFVKISLHALTVTMGVESERTIHHVPINQVDLTRRARNEEPQNSDEEEEELTRFVNAVLLTSAPLPDFSDSRYRSRIYRGNAITV